jgi:SAM-dependent methyltransferase
VTARTRKLFEHLVYPIRPPRRARWADRIAARPARNGKPKRFGPIVCTVCGQRGYALEFADVLYGLRETGRCSHCGATNRHRQIGLVLAGSVGDGNEPGPRSVRDVARSGLRIHNTETTGPIHRELLPLPTYTASEYFGAAHRSGDVVGGVLHQDLMALSFPTNSVDVVITSDVFEHVADPYRAHHEIYRVLRPGGVHIFTVPFLETQYLDERRAEVDDDGTLTHLAEPVYHADPINPEPGALVFTYFSLEMLVRLKEIGFDTEFYWVHKPTAGILGQEACVFAAVKPRVARA